MIGSVIFLAPLGYFSGGALGNLFNTWAAVGVFSHLLPFLIVFSIIFAVLEKANLFSNKGVRGLLAISIGLLAVTQFDVVPRFFSTIFPKLGVGLSVILVFMIFLGMAPGNNSEARIKTWLIIVGAIVGVVIVYTSFFQDHSFLYTLGLYLLQNWIHLLFVIIILVILFGVLFGGNDQ